VAALDAGEDEGSPPGAGLPLATTVLAFSPLIAHRVFERLAAEVGSPAWAEIAGHTLPPAAMVLLSVLLWRRIGALPGVRQSKEVSRPLCIAAGLLLGTLAAVANLLSMLASRSRFAASASVGPGTAALVLHVMLLAPLAEEAAFRGILYRHLRQAIAPVGAALAASLVFAVMHGSVGQAVWAFVLGLVAAFAFEQTASLVTPTLVHVLFNAVPIGVAVVRARPDDVGPVWFVLAFVAIAFTLAARGAGRVAARG
jgi:membrane protease YdiL (CAAX protease family)